MSDVVTNAVSYRGTDLLTFSGNQLRLCFRLTSGLHSGLQVRGADWTIPALAGRQARNRLVDRRLLEVEGFAQGCGSTFADQQADFETAMQTLDSIFDPTLAAGTLVVTLQDGTTATIEARTLPETLEAADPIPTRREMSYRLEAIDPDWEYSGS